MHPHGHEEPQEVSRNEFEAAVRAASHVEQDTLEVLSPEKMVGGMRQELNLMKVFLRVRSSSESGVDM